MFSNFSWTNYFSFVGFVLFAYFIILLIICYKMGYLPFLFGRNHLQESIDAQVKQTPELLPMVHELVSELGVVIRGASENKTVLPELLAALQEKVKDFSLLQYSEYKAKINLYITQELEICGYHDIRQELVEQLWARE